MHVDQPYFACRKSNSCSQRDSATRVEAQVIPWQNGSIGALKRVSAEYRQPGNGTVAELVRGRVDVVHPERIRHLGHAWPGLLQQPNVGALKECGTANVL